MVDFTNLIKRFLNLQIVFRSALILLILFLIFFAINLFISVKNKPETAFNALIQNEQKKLQDTRVHNWSEIDKEK